MAIIEKGNPYTHSEEKRESMANHDPKQGCDWCGKAPKTLYKYNDKKGWFCNRDCFVTYHF